MATDPIAGHIPRRQRALCSQIPSSSQGPISFSATLDMDKFQFNQRDSAPGVPMGALAMKASPFFHWVLLSKKGCKTELSYLGSGELESACLASSQRRVAVPARAPGPRHRWAYPDALLNSEALVLRRQGEAVFHCSLGDSLPGGVTRLGSRRQNRRGQDSHCCSLLEACQGAGR